jgi:hypothetical protein
MFSSRNQIYSAPHHQEAAGRRTQDAQDLGEFRRCPKERKSDVESLKQMFPESKQQNKERALNGIGD